MENTINDHEFIWINYEGEFMGAFDVYVKKNIENMED